MASECSLCSSRHIETCAIVSPSLGFFEFCSNCADYIVLTNAETGERATPRELFNKSGANICPFPQTDRRDPPAWMSQSERDSDPYACDCDESPIVDDSIDIAANALEDRETLAELPTLYDRSASPRIAWERDGFMRNKGPRGGYAARKPRNRQRDRRKLCLC